MSQDIIDTMFVGKALNFAQQHNYKGLLGFLGGFIFLPSFIWHISFNSYLGEETEGEIFENDECQDLLGWSHAASFFYWLFWLSAVVIAIWGYFVMGWEQKVKNPQASDEGEVVRTPEDVQEEEAAKPKLAWTQPYFNWVIKIYPGAYYFIMIILYFGLSWNHEDVDFVTCEPLRSFVLVYLVLHTLFYGFILIVMCSGLIGAGAYLRKYGFDEVLSLDLQGSGNNQQQTQGYQPISSHIENEPRISVPYYGTRSSVQN